MIWFVIFFTLVGASIVCTRLFVPIEHIRNYARCRKDRAYYLAALLSNAIWIVAAVQHVVAPDPFSTRLKLTGVVYFIVGQVLVIWSRRVNDLFVPAIIYVPPVWRVKSGPYRLMNHPGFWGFILWAIGTACMLGGWWATFPLSAYVFLILRRMAAEDRVLARKESL